MHPLVVDGDHEERIGNLSWLLTNSLHWLRAVPIASGPQGRFGLNAFEAAHTRSANAGSGDDEGQPSLDLLEAVRRDTPHDFYRQLVDALLNCAEALQSLQAAVDDRLGIDGPSFSAVREQVEHLQRTVARFARDAGLLLDGEAEAGPHDMPGIGFGPAANRTRRRRRRRRHASRAAHRPPARKRWRSCVRSPNSSGVPNRTAPSPTWPKKPRAGARCRCTWLKRVIKDGSVLNQMEEMLDVNQNLEQ